MTDRPRPGGIAAWFADGERVPVELRGRRFTAWRRVVGDTGPWVTMLHGFPTCSYDWAPILPALAGRRVLMVDFLGFGDSDKPSDHTYDLVEQADLIEAEWRDLGVRSTAIVAHDYGVSVAQELLARRVDGVAAADVTSVAWLNGGLFPRLHRPILVQKLLRMPGVGPAIARAIGEGAFGRQLTKVLARPLPAAELHEHWLGVANRGGSRIYHRLIRYIDDRRRHETRWVGALIGCDLPMRFLWGMRDPVSGAHVAEHLARVVSDAVRHEWDDVGHYPQLEAPDRVRAALADLE